VFPQRVTLRCKIQVFPKRSKARVTQKAISLNTCHSMFERSCGCYCRGWPRQTNKDRETAALLQAWLGFVSGRNYREKNSPFYEQPVPGRLRKGGNNENVKNFFLKSER